MAFYKILVRESWQPSKALVRFISLGVFFLPSVLSLSTVSGTANQAHWRRRRQPRGVRSDNYLTPRSWELTIIVLCHSIRCNL